MCKNTMTTHVKQKVDDERVKVKLENTFFIIKTSNSIKFNIVLKK